MWLVGWRRGRGRRGGRSRGCRILRDRRRYVEVLVMIDGRMQGSLVGTRCELKPP